MHSLSDDTPASKQTQIHNQQDDPSLRLIKQEPGYTCVLYVWVAVDGSLGQEDAFYLHYAHTGEPGVTTEWT